MKNLLFACLFLTMFTTVLVAQPSYERSGYYGDNFSLEGALDLFEKSRSLDDFERRLNNEENWINNLDLDNDRRIDYIRVEHRRFDRNFHAIVLQINFGRNDVQDVAVIELEQVGTRKVDIQIVGDEDIYGNEVFIEPYGASERDVYRWPVVQSILDNQYTTYVSPYRWDYYPTWWSPWRPLTWDIYRPRIIVFQPRYRIISVPRFVHVRNYYRPHRAYCNNVVIVSNTVRVRHGHNPINRPNYTNNGNNNRGNDQYYGSRRNGQTTDINRNNGTTRSGERSDNTQTRDRGREYRGQDSQGSDRNNGSQRQGSGRDNTTSGDGNINKDQNRSTSPRVYDNKPSGDDRSRTEAPANRPQRSSEDGRNNDNARPSPAPRNHESTPSKSSGSKSSPSYERSRSESAPQKPSSGSAKSNSKPSGGDNGRSSGSSPRQGSRRGQ